MKCVCGQKVTCENCESCLGCCDCADRPCLCGEEATCSTCQSCSACCQCNVTSCYCGKDVTCNACNSCMQCCVCNIPMAARRFMRNPRDSSLIRKLPKPIFLSTEEIFRRIEGILKLVQEKGYQVPKLARNKIGEELVKLGYELLETED